MIPTMYISHLVGSDPMDFHQENSPYATMQHWLTWLHDDAFNYFDTILAYDIETIDRDMAVAQMVLRKCIA